MTLRLRKHFNNNFKMNTHFLDRQAQKKENLTTLKPTLSNWENLKGQMLFRSRLKTRLIRLCKKKLNLLLIKFIAKKKRKLIYNKSLHKLKKKPCNKLKEKSTRKKTQNRKKKMKMKMKI
jgi:hypothetical protein